MINVVIRALNKMPRSREIALLSFLAMFVLVGLADLVLADETMIPLFPAMAVFGMIYATINARYAKYAR